MIAGIVKVNDNIKKQVDFNPSSAGTDFRRQNLTSVDVRFWRLKAIPAWTGRVNMYIGCRPITWVSK